MLLSCRGVQRGLRTCLVGSAVCHFYLQQCGKETRGDIVALIIDSIWHNGAAINEPVRHTGWVFLTDRALTRLSIHKCRSCVTRPISISLLRGASIQVRGGEADADRVGNQFVAIIKDRLFSFGHAITGSSGGRANGARVAAFKGMCAITRIEAGVAHEVVVTATFDVVGTHAHTLLAGGREGPTIRIEGVSVSMTKELAPFDHSVDEGKGEEAGEAERG